MYDALLITFDLDIYCVKFKIATKALVYLLLSPPFAHIHSSSWTPLGTHRTPVVPDAC